jgi:toxin HigB-1
VIKSFADSQTEQFYGSGRSRRLPASLHRVAKRKLFQLEFARRLSDLASPPGNRLEALKGEREGQYSIRINDQYRLCFEFRNGDAYDVAIVDYH